MAQTDVQIVAAGVDAHTRWAQQQQKQQQRFFAPTAGQMTRRRSRAVRNPRKHNTPRAHEKHITSSSATNHRAAATIAATTTKSRVVGHLDLCIVSAMSVSSAGCTNECGPHCRFVGSSRHATQPAPKRARDVYECVCETAINHFCQVAARCARFRRLCGDAYMIGDNRQSPACA